MAARKIMADAGGTRKVIGKRMATPFTEPNPGMAPMNSPRVTPTTIRPKLSGWIASKKPPARRDRISMFLPAP